MPGAQSPCSTKGPLVAVIGPTASGKTSLGIFISQRFKGEIVSADAKQVYRGMDIGTAKEIDSPVVQHLIDFKEPGEKVTVGEYQRKAYECIDRLLERHILPVMVGGSGLYVESVTNGYLFTNGTVSERQKPHYNVLKLGIAFERSVLKERARKRLLERIDQGLVKEVEGLLAKGTSPEWLLHCGIEYKYVTLFLQGALTYEEMVEKIATAINQFIKRQYTWWRRHDDVVWIASMGEAESHVEAFLQAQRWKFD